MHHIDQTISVNIDAVLGAVTIIDLEGVQDDIFLDPLQAEDFAAEVADLMAADEHMTRDVAEVIAATPIAENLWN